MLIRPAQCAMSVATSIFGETARQTPKECASLLMHECMLFSRTALLVWTSVSRRTGSRTATASFVAQNQSRQFKHELACSARRMQAWHVHATTGRLQVVARVSCKICRYDARQTARHALSPGLKLITSASQYQGTVR